jgi:hypothetical protein
MERNSWGVSLFSDDVRFEVGGKISLIGIYTIDMIVGSAYPLLIPKLFVSIRYFEIRDAFVEDLVVKIFLPGIEEPFFEQRIPRPPREAVIEPYPVEEDGSSVIFIHLVQPLQNVPILKEGPIRVRMHCGDVVTQLGRLVVRAARPDEQLVF